MKIESEKTDQQLALITVTVEESDYKEKVEKDLQELRKKAVLRGFRPGKTPMGIIKKLSGKQVTMDVVGKLLGEKLQEFLQNDTTRYLGDPILSSETSEIDYDNSTEFVFKFDLGIIPDVNIELNKKIVQPYYKVEPKQDIIDQIIADFQTRASTLEKTEVVTAKSTIVADFIELDDDGNAKTDGIVHEGKFIIEFVADGEFKTALLEAVVGTELVTNIKESFVNDAEIASLLNIEKDRATTLTSNFKITVKEIQELVKGELTQSLFDEIFGEGIIQSEEQLREYLGSINSGFLDNIAADLFINRFIDDIIEKSDIKINEDFYRRWLAGTRETEQDYIDNNFKFLVSSLTGNIVKSHLKIQLGIPAELAPEILHAGIERYVTQLLFNRQMYNATFIKSYAGYIKNNENELYNIREKLVNELIFEKLSKLITIEERLVDEKEFEKIREEYSMKLHGIEEQPVSQLEETETDATTELTSEAEIIDQTESDINNSTTDIKHDTE